MAVTEKNITSTGATSYTFEFEYLKTADVKVSVDGTATTQFTVPNGAPTTVQFNSGHVPASGKAIRIYRDTDVDTLSATFYAGSAIKSQDLNDNFNQNLFVTQEAKRDVASAWQGGDETIDSNETWVGNNERVATTGAIDGRVDAKIDAALTTDVSGGDGVTIVDNNPGSGQIRVDLDADIATLKDMQSGAATQLAALTSAELAILDGATASTDELNLLDGVTSTTAELNILDGVTSTAAELNILDGVTATKDELNILDGVTATKDEINILDGVTSTAAELNILDGVTATKDEINILDGVTATAAELNTLDGVTATAAELNILDGVTATAAELNKTDGLTSTPTELNILDGATANTSEINKLDGVTASTAELNIVSGKSFKTSSGTLDTTSDTEIPSSKVIAAHVASSQTAIGGFVTIADEVSFPNTQPANGVVISINNAAGVVVNGSGVSTSAKRADNTTVTINGFPSSLNGETLAAGVGLVVTSTSTANTYAYHKLLAAETDVKQLSDDINDFNQRYRVASSAPGSSNDAGDMYFDTSANKMKVYNATTSAWDDVASVGSFYVNTLSSSGSGSDTIPGGSSTFNGTAKKFTLSNPGTSAQQHIVSINGVIQKPNSGTGVPSEGFALSGNDIIFSDAPASGADAFIVTCGSSVSIGTPSANSVNSSHIIDGSIVNGDISSTANIAGSKVADDSIAEVKLDIHNAPATDKYLKYTSNGMEWSDGASEGTDVKSTGESGTTKFLRVDGDGTCSWQPVTGFVRDDNASTSTGQLNLNMPGNEPLRITQNYDAKITLQGSNNPYIQYKEGTTLKALVGWDANGYVKINNQEDASELRIQDDLKFSVDGTTFHSVLTSNSTLDSTKLSPAISAAPEVKLTASEAITAEDAIMVKTNGQAEKVTGVISGLGPVATTFGTGPSAYQMQYHANIAWDENAEKWVCIFMDRQNSTRLSVMVGTPSGTSIVWGNKTQFNTFNTPNDLEKCRIALVYNPALSKCFYAIRNDSSSGRMLGGHITISGTGTSATATATHSNTMGANNQMNMNAVYNSNLGVLVAFSAGNSGNRPRVTRMDISSESAMNDMSTIELYQSNMGHYSMPDIAYSSSSPIFAVVFKENTSKPRVNCIRHYTFGQVGNTNGDLLSQDQINNNCGPKVAWSSGDNVFLCIYPVSNMLKGLIFTATSGGSVTSYSDFIINTSPYNAINVANLYEVSYNATADRFIVVYSYAGSTGTYLRVLKYNSSTNQCDMETPLDFNPGAQSEFMAIANNSDDDRFGIIYNTESSSAAKIRTYTPDNSNIDPARFVGFAKSSVSSGAEVTVKVNSNTSTRSGLTPASNYYVLGDGSLGTSPAPNGTIKAGLALTSTELLIKD